jgi:hypothetical protein
VCKKWWRKKYCTLHQQKERNNGRVLSENDKENEGGGRRGIKGGRRKRDGQVCYVERR